MVTGEKDYSQLYITSTLVFAAFLAFVVSVFFEGSAETYGHILTTLVVSGGLVLKKWRNQPDIVHYLIMAMSASILLVIIIFHNIIYAKLQTFIDKINKLFSDNKLILSE